jgi:hypothetical protein
MYQAVFAGRVLPGGGALLRSEGVWLALVTFLGLVHLFIVFVGGGLQDDPRAVLFSWPAIGIIGLAGLVGIWLADRTGFPAAWDACVSNRQRFALPVAVGLGLGLFDVGYDLIFHGTAAFAANHELGAFNAPFPGSLLFYPGGAIIVEVVYRLLPIPLLLWLISSLLLRGRFQTPLFWTLAVLTSLIEPMQQDLPELAAGTSAIVVFSEFAIAFAQNMTQATFFRKYGVLAAIMVRVAMYLVWHVGYGNFICRC